MEALLSPAGAASSEMEARPRLSEAAFEEQLGPCGRELLAGGVAGLVRDVETVLPYFKSRATGME